MIRQLSRDWRARKQASTETPGAMLSCQRDGNRPPRLTAEGVHKPSGNRNRGYATIHTICRISPCRDLPLTIFSKSLVLLCQLCFDGFALSPRTPDHVRGRRKRSAPRALPSFGRVEDPGSIQRPFRVTAGCAPLKRRMGYWREFALLIYFVCRFARLQISGS